MREIKFRAWDPDAKKMIYTPEKLRRVLYLETDNGFHMGRVKSKDNGDWVSFQVMQFTELQDKNGNEVYEGDIVQWDDNSNGRYWRIAEVFWNTNEAMFAYKIIKCINCDIKPGYVFGGNFMYRDGRNLEVIGNIYQNQELL